MAIYRFGQKIKELFIKGRSIAKVYDHGRLVFSKTEEVVYYTISINPTPSTATVTLTYDGTTITGKTITVPAGSVVSYSVSATGYVSQSSTVTADSNKNISVTLAKDVSTVRWRCYHYYDTIPGQYSDSEKHHFYFYIQPGVTSGANVWGAGQKANDGNYTLDIVCSNKGTTLYPVKATWFVGSSGFAPYLIKTVNDGSAVIYPQGTSSTGAAIRTGMRDTSGDIY